LRTRLYRILPAVLKEGLAGTFGWPWNKTGNSEFSANPLVE